MPFFLRLQLVDLGGDHQVRPPVRFEPVSQLDILFHPTPPRVQNKDASRKRPASEQVALDELLPLPRDFLGDFCESIPWQIDEAETAVDLVEIDQLRTARPGTGTRQPVGSHQRIQQTGFADVAAAQKRDLRVRSPAETAPAWLHLL